MRKGAAAVGDAIQEMGRSAITIKADTREPQEVSTMVDEAMKSFGTIDILINNAGGCGLQLYDYTVLTVEHWKQMMAAEIDGAFWTMKYIVLGMRERRWGRIVHLGLSGSRLVQNMAEIGNTGDYFLGKAARAWMTTAFGLQEYEHNITVNCIEPGGRQDKTRFW